MIWKSLIKIISDLLSDITDLSSSLLLLTQCHSNQRKWITIFMTVHSFLKIKNLRWQILFWRAKFFLYMFNSKTKLKMQDSKNVVTLFKILQITLGGKFFIRDASCIHHKRFIKQYQPLNVVRKNLYDCD